MVVVIILLTLALASAAALAVRPQPHHRPGRGVAREQRTRERLGRYFSPQVAAHLAEQTQEFGHRREPRSHVLFADLRDFTALAEHLDGPSVVATLNASTRAWSNRCSPSAARSTSTSATG